MNKYKKLVAIAILFILTFSTKVHTKGEIQLPLMSAVSEVVQQYPGSSACTGIGLYLCHKYFQHKKRPSDADISPEAKIARWNEIVHGNHSIYEKLKLLISFIDDFYIFCRSAKVVSVKKTTEPDGTIKEVISDKKLVTAGRGPVAFLYYNIFDTLEEDVKKVGVLVTALIALDAILAGNLPHLLTLGAKATSDHLPKFSY